MKAIVRSAKKCAVVSIAEKFNSVQKLKICDLGAIDYLVTELGVGSAVLAAYSGLEKPVFL